MYWILARKIRLKANRTVLSKNFFKYQDRSVYDICKEHLYAFSKPVQSAAGLVS